MENRITILVLMLALFTAASAQSLGDIDSDFGSSGFTVTNYEADTAEYLNHLISLSNDKVLLCGMINHKNGFDILLSRLNKNGSIDLNFGNQGYTSFDLGQSSDRATAMLELNDGKVIVVGQSTKNGITDGYIMRLNADGSLDESFGEGSKGYTKFNAGKNTTCRPADIVRHNNSFYIAATVYSDGTGSDFGLFKFSAYGALVPSFASGGSNLVDVKGIEYVTSLEVGSDGTFLIGGTSQINNTQYGAIVKLNAYGLKTSAFDGAGYFVYNEGSGLNTIRDVRYDSKKRIVAIGSEGTNPNRNGMIFRFDSNGLPDNTFGTSGKMSSDIGNSNGVYLTSLHIDKDDNLICTGYLAGQSYNDVYVLKLTDEGKAHPDFGTKGDVNYPVPLSPTYIHIHSSDVQSNGDLVLGGTTTVPGYDAYNITVSRVRHWEDANTASAHALESDIITLYPNPTTGSFQIDSKGKNVSEVALFDMQGRKVLSWDYASSGNYTVASHLERGAYLVKFLLDNALYTQRLIVE